MGLFNSGYKRNTYDDSLIAAQDPQGEAKVRGYIGDDYFYDEDGNLTQLTNSNMTGQGGSDWDPQGRGEDIVGGWRQAGTTAYDKDVDRYRRKGEEGLQRRAVQLDQGQADQARRLQVGALGMLRRRAEGSTPSAAAILSQRANQGALQHANAATLGAKTTGGALVAQRAGSMGAGQQALAGNAQNAAARAAEVSRAQSEYFGAAGQQRGQDITAGVANANLEAQQRQINEARRQQYERLGFDVRNTQAQTAVDWRTQSDAEAVRRAKAQAENKEATANETEQAFNRFTSTISGGLSK